MFDIETITRKNINSIEPYGVWRDTYLEDPEAVFLDNCENNYGSPLGKGYERYPSSSQSPLRAAIAAYKRVDVANLALGNGSDELIDLLIRCFCEPRRDSILVCEPTFGMYRIYAQLNDIAVLNAPLLNTSFLVDESLVLKTAEDTTRIIFICSPNNPTGTSIGKAQLKTIAGNFSGLVVVDEAYIDFSEKDSALGLLNEFPNLVVLQTFSKAWGLASLRVGAAYGSPGVIAVLNKVRPPFNISTTSQQVLLQALKKADRIRGLVNAVLLQKQWLRKELEIFSFIKRIVDSDANFFFIEVEDAGTLHRYLLDHHVLISNRSALQNSYNHIRISVGTETENRKLIALLKHYA
jgi:histidinol-phosphate aminotransferase